MKLETREPAVVEAVGKQHGKTSAKTEFSPAGCRCHRGFGTGSIPALPVGLRVRTARRSDLVPLNFFFDSVLRRDYFIRRGQLEEFISGKHHQVYLAEIDNVLVGVAITTAGCRLVNALVHPAYRGLGIGKQLVAHSGAEEVRVKLDMSSGNPREFYRRLGFAPTGRPSGKGNIEIMQRPTPKTNGSRLRKVR